MRDVPIDDRYQTTTLLGDRADIGARATPLDTGAQVAEQYNRLGEKFLTGGANLQEIQLMYTHIRAQQHVSNAMLEVKSDVSAYTSDPKNYTDPNYAKNLQQKIQGMLPQLQKNAPSVMARNQLTMEFNEFAGGQIEAAHRTQTEVALQKGFNDMALAPNKLLDQYRDNMKTPNVDASAELFKGYDDLLKKVEGTYHVIAPQMERELKDQITSQVAYGAVNTNPDLAEKILDRGYIEGRTRHFLEDAIQRAREAKDISQKQNAYDYTADLLKQAELFPERDLHAPGIKYYTDAGFTVKEAQNYNQKVTDKLDANLAFARVKNEIGGYNEQALLKKQGDMYDALKSSQHLDRDSDVYDRTSRFIDQGIKMLHEDPVAYLSQYNPQLRSAMQEVRDNQTPQKLTTLNNLLLKYQGAPPKSLDVEPGISYTTEESNKYLNLSPNEIHLLSKDASKDLVGQINGAPPGQGSDTLHSVLQQYPAQHRALVFNDLVHSGLNGEMWAVESHYDAPWRDELVGALQKGQQLRKDTADKQSDFNKAIDTNQAWVNWMKVTAADNFQRQDIVNDVRGAVMTYSLALSQKGKTPDEAVRTAVTRLVDEDHVVGHLNGVSVYVPTDAMKHPISGETLSQRLDAALHEVDVRQVNEVGGDGRKLFPILDVAGHPDVRAGAKRDIITQRGFFRLNPDNQSYSLYIRGTDGIDFEARDMQDHPFTIRQQNLPIITREVYHMTPPPTLAGVTVNNDYGYFKTNWPSMTRIQHE